MRRFQKIIIGILIGSTAYAADPPARFHTPSRDSVLILERFEYPGQIGQFPVNWEGRSGWRQKRTRKKEDLYYTIQAENGDHFLRAETVGRATNAGRPAKVNLRVWKKLRWRWRVHSLPAGGNENHKETNDSAAAVRLVFKGRYIPKTLKYVWSATLPAGTETESPLSDNTKVIVLQSGSRNAGKWIWEEVNAYEDYRRLFGSDPRLVGAVAVLTDSDNTKTFVKADYDDISFLMEPPQSSDRDPDAEAVNQDRGK
ncbi:MAG: DUF3047 domain-containing protein [Gemmatimonadota bacterium]|nr:DUF3047 domain-containing protein [Gemmatimonadota bacterium]